jgi:hypothetical protein
VDKRSQKDLDQSKIFLTLGNQLWKEIGKIQQQRKLDLREFHDSSIGGLNDSIDKVDKALPQKADKLQSTGSF